MCNIDMASDPKYVWLLFVWSGGFNKEAYDVGRSDNSSHHT